MGSAVTLGATPAAPASSLLLTSGYVTVMCVRPCPEWAPCWASEHNTHETQSLPLRRSPEGGGDRPSGSSAEWEGSQDAAAPGEGLPPQLSCRRQQKVAECRDGGEEEPAVCGLEEMWCGPRVRRKKGTARDSGDGHGSPGTVYFPLPPFSTLKTYRSEGWGKGRREAFSPGPVSQVPAVTTSAGPFTQRTVPSATLEVRTEGWLRPTAEEGCRAFSLPSQLPAKPGSTLFTFPPLTAASRTYQLFYISWV